MQEKVEKSLKKVTSQPHHGKYKQSHNHLLDNKYKTLQNSYFNNRQIK